MLDEALGLLLASYENRNGPPPGVQRVYVDCTFGAGGFSEALLRRDSSCRVVALDADRAAWQRAQALASQHAGRLIALHANFAELASALDTAGYREVDGSVYDLGLSSPQLADPRRGFAFSIDAPLDMRLDDAGGGPTAADLLASLSEAELADLFFGLAEEHNARRIARQIVRRRERSPLLRTGDLVAAVLSALPAGSRRRHAAIHPATRTFQALRIAVNDELGALRRSLEAAVDHLKPGARCVVISFHSGEDRVVKRSFLAARSAGIAKILTSKPLLPTESEVRANPRSRSAKLRAIEKIGVVALPEPGEAA